MALFRNAKRPIWGMLYNSRMGGSRYTTWSSQGTAIAESTQVKASDSGFLGLFCRRFSSQALSSTEQMSLIKKLRERTSAPIKEVKASLVECNWNIEAAQKDLRKRGKAMAMKKSSRAATEGLLALAQGEGKAAIIELNCETDFVARNEIFQYLALTLAKHALLVGNSPSEVFSFNSDYLEGMKLNLEHPKISGETTIQNAVTEVAAMMGENVRFRRGFLMSTASHGVVSTYLHSSPQPGLGRIAGVLSLEVEDENASLDALQNVGSELAMHIVATKPLFLTKEEVSSDALENEQEILQSQAESTGKSAMAIEKMVEGRLRKYFEEVVLMEQKYFLNDSLKIKAMLDNVSKEVSSHVKVGKFFRMEVGEGIQRLEESATAEAV